MRWTRGSGSSPLSRPATLPIVPPTALVLLAIGSVQVGSAVATHLFAALGPAGATLLRVGFAALVLLPLWRPRRAGYSVREIALAALFGLTVAAMNLSFYSALNRIPLGIAVTLEFVGPLGVAFVGMRRALDGLWVVLAAGGIVLLTPWGGGHIDSEGVLFALLAGGFWAGYIVLSARVGKVFPGGQGLAIAMVAGAIALLPIGIASGGVHFLQPAVLAGGLAAALLSSVIPYSLELEALRSLPTQVFGVLMSLEPAVAALIGFVVLHQVLGVRAVVALALVSVSSLGASRTGPPAVLD